MDGQDGNDTIEGGAGMDTFYGGNGNDIFYARDSIIESIFGGAGTDAAQSDANDVLNSVEGPPIP